MTRTLLVLDTTVCIDLWNGNLVELALRLPYRLALPDVIVAELKQPPGSALVKHGFDVLSLEPTEMPAISRLAATYTSPSVNDLFALLVSKLHGGHLVTGDAGLRRAAHEEHVQVHGLLWLLDRIVENSPEKRTQVTIGLEQILAEGSWLPDTECVARLKRWRQ